MAILTKKSTLKIALLGGMSAVAFASTNAAFAADATTEVADTNTISATTATGLLESNETGAVGVTVDASAGNITLGANGTDAITITEATGGTDLTITKNGTNALILADDVVLKGNVGDRVFINNTAGAIVIQGNVTAPVGSAIITSGDGAGNTSEINFDTVNNEDLVINATINAAATGDTVAVNVANTDSANANKITFAGAVGIVQVDEVNLGANTTATFSSTVEAGAININAATANTTFNGNVTGNVAFANGAATTVNFGADALLTGNLTNATAGEATVVFADVTTDGAVVTGNVGASGTNVASVTFGAGASQTATITGNVFSNAVVTQGAGNTTISGTTTATTITAGAGGTNTFTGNVTATTINAGAGTTAFDGNVSGTVNFTADGTATFGADDLLTGAITTATDNTGTVTFANVTADGTVASGDLGASGNALKAVTVGADASQTATVGGNVFATTFTTAGAGNVAVTGTVTGAVTAGGTGTVTFNETVTGATNFTADGTVSVADDKNLAGAITTGTANTGTVTYAGKTTIANTIGVIGGNELKAVNFNAGNAAVNANIAATTITVANGASITTDGAGQFEGNLNNDGTVTLGGTLTIAGTGHTVDLSTGGNAVVNLAKTGDYTGSAVVSAAGSTINLANSLTVNPDATFTTGTLKLVDTDNTAGNITTNVGQITVSGSTILTSYTAAAGTGADAGDIILTAAAKSDAVVAASLGTTSQEAGALQQAGAVITANQADANATAALAILNAAGASGASATDTAAAKTLAEQIGTQADTLGAGTQSMIAAGGQVFGVAQQRLAAVRTGQQYASAEAGFAAGDMGEDVGVWMKPFGVWNRQDDKDGIAGYDANTYGIAAGVDFEVAPNVRVGVSGAYSTTDVEGEGAGNSELDVKSYQGTIYADYTADSFYVDAMVGFARNDAEAKRTITATSDVAEADYDNNQFMAGIHAGMPLEIGNSTFVTPTAGLDWTRVEGDNYTETGAGVFNQSVDQDDVNALVGTLGAKVHSNLVFADGVLTPEVRGGLTYDFIGDEAVATSTFSGGGVAYRTEGIENEKFGGYAGLGFTYEVNGVSFGAGYDAEFKQDFVGHNASIEARFKF